jgi:cytochrome b involved in lipid metabolism
MNAFVHVDAEQLIAVVTHDTVYCRINELVHRISIFLDIRKP